MIFRMKFIYFVLLFFSFPVFAETESLLRCPLVPQVMRLYLRQHYVYRDMNEELQKRTVDQFIESSDPSRILLYQSEVDQLKKDLPKLFKTMPYGDCSQITELQKLLVTRVDENLEIAREILGDKYTLNENVELVTDPTKRAYAKNKAEKKSVIEKLTHFQISNQLLGKTKMPDAKKNVLHSYELSAKRVKEKTESKILADLSDSFARALDPHSGYLSPESLEEFKISMQLSLEGIGATLSSQDGFTVIEELVPGGAADRTGKLKQKDKILTVMQDGQKPVTVYDMDLSDVVRQIRGKKGTKVTLSILRQDEDKRFEVTIVRDKIDIKDSAAKITFEEKKTAKGAYKVALVELPSFYGGGRDGRSCYRDMREAVLQAKKNKADGMVLDLSRNGGGLLEDAVRIAGLFIKKGPVVSTKAFNGQIDVLSDKDSDVEWNGPLVIVISRSSASASEILAGAMKDYHRALIVGSDHTFGKGSVQVISDLAEGLGAMRITQGMFFIPGGASTQHVGVASDIVVPSAFSIDELGEKSMDYSLPPQKIATFLGEDANSTDPTQKWKPVESKLIDDLKKKSEERVAKDPKFVEIRKNLEEAQKNKGVIRLAEIRKKAVEEKKKESDEKKSRKEKIKDAQEPLVIEGTNILLDWMDFEKEHASHSPSVSLRSN